MGKLGDHAVSKFTDSGYNCCQAVICACCEEYGVKELDAFKMTEGFGAGMGLPNMKKYTDKMEVKTHLGVGTKITMVVNI